jgi:hypothetical protein
MVAFLQANIGTILVAVLVAVIVVSIIVSIHKRKKGAFPPVVAGAATVTRETAAMRHKTTKNKYPLRSEGELS